MSMLAWSPTFGRLIRQDDETELGRPTRERFEAAVREGDATEAKRWLDYLLAEIEAVWGIFGVWDWHLVRYVLDRKTDASLASLLEASIAPWVGTTAGSSGDPIARVDVDGPDARLTVPGLERPFVLTAGTERYQLTIGEPDDHARRWAAWRRGIDAAIDSGSGEETGRRLDAHLHEVRLIHDILCDWAWGLLTVIGREWGEGILGDAQRTTLEPWVTVRYEALRDMSVSEIMEITIEGMRGHFTGPDRTGAIDVTEEPDRYVLSFDACGTGGRMRRGDPLAGSGSRYDAPYHFATIEGAYDWTWGREGVCSYCSHCSVVNQILPIEGIGRPLRLTEYPDEPGDPCRWIIYKEGEAFPDVAYTAVGKVRDGTT